MKNKLDRWKFWILFFIELTDWWRLNGHDRAFDLCWVDNRIFFYKNPQTFTHEQNSKSTSIYCFFNLLVLRNCFFFFNICFHLWNSWSSTLLYLNWYTLLNILNRYFLFIIRFLNPGGYGCVAIALHVLCMFGGKFIHFGIFEFVLMICNSHFAHIIFDWFVSFLCVCLICIIKERYSVI